MPVESGKEFSVESAFHASKVFEKVYLVIAINSEKKRRIDKEKMKNAIEMPKKVC